MKLKYSFFYLFFIFSMKLFSIEVIVAKIDIPYNNSLKPSDIFISEIDKLPANCIPITIDELKKDKYISNKFLIKEKVICKDDLKKEKENKVIFNFGSIEIETSGKIMYENDEFIKIKKENGKIEKIYKDGRVR